MQMKRIAIVLFILMLQSNLLMAQKPQAITKEQAVADVDWYLGKVAELHPGMYHLTPKPVVDSLFHVLKQKFLAQPGDSIDVDWFVDEWEQYNYLIEYSGITGNYAKGDKWFPALYWTAEGEAWLPDKQFRVTAINGISIDTLRDYLHCTMIRDNEDTRLSNIKINGNRIFQEALDHYHLVSPYRVEGIGSDGKPAQLELQDYSTKELNADLYRYCGNAGGTSTYFRGRKELCQLEIYKKDSLAIIRQESARHDAIHEDLVRSFFLLCRLQGIKYLFLDLSRSQGGGLNGCHFFDSYLDYDPTLSYKIKMRNNQTDGWWDVNMSRTDPNAQPFQGELFVYQSYYTIDYPAIEAAMLKAMAHATIVGTESGRVGYLSAKHYTLPHSQRQVFIPDMLYEEESPALPRTADGRLLPDIPYPFLVDRRLGVEDCLKIIELNKERR